MNYITEPVQPIGPETQAYIDRHRPVLTREAIEAEYDRQVNHAYAEHLARLRAARHWRLTELLRAGAGE